jgi:hypothetical protein
VKSPHLIILPPMKVHCTSQRDRIDFLTQAGIMLTIRTTYGFGGRIRWRRTTNGRLHSDVVCEGAVHATSTVRKPRVAWGPHRQPTAFLGRPNRTQSRLKIVRGRQIRALSTATVESVFREAKTPPEKWARNGTTIKLAESKGALMDCARDVTESPASLTSPARPPCTVT